MAKTRYTPFLKLKANEVGAIAELSADVKQCLVPFFDLPRKDGMTEAAFCTMVTKSARKIEKYLGVSQSFYLDNFDIPDDITVGGGPSYRFVVDEFSSMSFIPVLGLDRTAAHNQAVFKAKQDGVIQSDIAAVRLLEDDFEAFELIEDELRELFDGGKGSFNKWVLILDCRVCLNLIADAHAIKLSQFIEAAVSAFKFAEIIVTGSSVPASISDVAKVAQQSALERIELQIYQELRSRTSIEPIGLGDYTVVSPMYSEITLPPEMMLNVTAPKVIYSHDAIHYIARGGALKTHARGNLQYNDIAVNIVSSPFYRGSAYSYGDCFLDEKAQMMGSLVTPGSILKPTINAHITYMATDHPLLT